MKNSILILILLNFAMASGQYNTAVKEKMETSNKSKLLRHVVFFKFKKETSAKQIKEVEMAFHELPEKIKEIYSYEWGLNNSPENLDKGFTHCFFLTFKTEADRAIYLPHPDHKAFGEILSPYLEDVLVFDYWTN